MWYLIKQRVNSMKYIFGILCTIKPGII
jgi:hypothetical protein